MKTLLLLANLVAISCFGQGSVGAGTGGTISERVDLESVQTYLNQVRGELYANLNFLMMADYASENAILQGLVTESKSIFETIQKYGIHIENKKPCYSDRRKPADGSIHSPTPNTICISAKRIQKKLSKYSYKPQILALVGHEYSHLIGYNEQQAEALQKVLLQGFSDERETLDDYLLRLPTGEFTSRYFETQEQLNLLKTEIEKKPEDRTLDLDSALRNLVTTWGLGMDFIRAFYPALGQLYITTLIRFHLMEIGVCSRNPHDYNCGWLLKKNFPNAETEFYADLNQLWTRNQYLRSFRFGSMPMATHAPIYKITSDEILKQEIDQAILEASQVTKELSRLIEFLAKH